MVNEEGLRILVHNPKKLIMLNLFLNPLAIRTYTEKPMQISFINFVDRVFALGDAVHA